MASGLGDRDPLIGHYMGDHLFRQAVFRLPEPIGEKALYIFIPPTAERPYHVQMQGMFPETWYSPCMRRSGSMAMPAASTCCSIASA